MNTGDVGVTEERGYHNTEIEAPEEIAGERNGDP